MQTADEIKRAGADDDPRPVRDGEMLLHVLDLVMQQERRDAQGEAENGDAAEWDRHAHHALPPHRLEHEQAEDAIHEVERPMTSSDGVKFSHLVSKIVVVDARSARRKAGSPIKHPQTTQRMR